MRNLRVAIIGGNLQGVEAPYLAHKTGWEVLVIDRGNWGNWGRCWRVCECSYIINLSLFILFFSAFFVLR
jgi:monoamine oxidase